MAALVRPKVASRQRSTTAPTHHSPAALGGPPQLGELRLEDQVLLVGRDSPGARNRFIYSDGAMHALPSSPLTLLPRPPAVLRGLVGAVLREPFVPPRPSTAPDESVYDFFSRRLSSGTPCRQPPMVVCPVLI